MASINFSVAIVIALSGLLILGAVETTEAVCYVMCAQGTYVTCINRPGQNFTGWCTCDQQCAPPGCGGCSVHLADGSTMRA